jgi:hypothetical protein
MRLLGSEKELNGYLLLLTVGLLASAGARLRKLAAYPTRRSTAGTSIRFHQFQSCPEVRLDAAHLRCQRLFFLGHCLMVCDKAFVVVVSAEYMSLPHCHPDPYLFAFLLYVFPAFVRRSHSALSHFARRT